MENEAINLVINYQYEIVRFLLFVFATIGFTNIIVHGKIMEVIGIRPWLRSKMKPDHFSVFECYECSGFWCGMIVGLCLYPWYFILCGFAGSVLCSTYTDLIYWIRGMTSFEIPYEEPQIEETQIEEETNP